MIRECPCRWCVSPNRHVGCHSSCQLYIDWRKELDLLKKELEGRQKAEQLKGYQRPVRQYKKL